MNNSNNIEMIKIIADGLGEKLEDVVFVGGSLLELYIDDPAINEPRATDDVDFVIDIITWARYDEFEAELRKKGFINDIDGPICRMIYNEVKTDIISTSQSIVGFTNKWYEVGFERSIQIKIDDIEIKIFPVEYFIASKFEAFKDRGKGNLILSEDFEDIIYIFDGRKTISEDIKNTDSKVKNYLVNEINSLLSNPSTNEAITGHLGYGSAPERTERIINIFKEFTKL